MRVVLRFHQLRYNCTMHIAQWLTAVQSRLSAARILIVGGCYHCVSSDER